MVLIASLAFAPDGRALASGGHDTTVLLWDLTGQAHRPASASSPIEPETPWVALADRDAARADDALWTLTAAPAQAIAVLRRHVRPAAAPDPEDLRRLIDDLNSDRFPTREKAAAELERLGDLAEPALRQALAGKPSLEVRRRLEGLLDRLMRQTLSPDALREVRAVELLERLGTPEARAILVELAGGAPGARLTRDAKQSLERLARRPAAGK